MSTRSQRDMGLWVAIGLTLLLILASALGKSDDLERTQTSYGKVLSGYGALYDFLHTLAPEVTRSRAAFRKRSLEKTVWLVQPSFLERTTPTLARSWLTDGPDELHAFLERGGVAVVIGSERADWSAFGLKLSAPSEHAQFWSDSDLGPHRSLELRGLRRFAAAEGGDTQLRAGGQGVVVSKPVGKGRLIAVSDARLFDNEHLELADHSMLALDLARAYGPPVFDESCHGLVDNASLAAAVGGGRLLLLALGFGLWGLTVLYARRAVPSAELPERAEVVPGLGSFVDPLALLYSRSATRHAGAVYRAYASGLRFRLRRCLFGPRGGTDALLDQRLAQDLGDDAELLAALRGQHTPRGPRELEAAAQRMERYLGTVTHTRERG